MPLGRNARLFKEKLLEASAESPSRTTSGEFDILNLRQVVEETFNNFLKDVNPVSDSISSSHLLIRQTNGRLIKAAIFTPKSRDKNEKLPAIIFNPAGGLALDMAHHQYNICSTVAEAGNAIVVCIQPQLSPEIKLPEIFSDAYDATKYFYQNAEHFGIDPEQFIISGYSMGGTVALNITLHAIKTGDFKVAAQIIVSGVTRLYALPKVQGEDFMFDPTTHQKFVEMCLPQSENLKSISDEPLYNPTIHPCLDQVPRTYLITGECDAFRSDSEAMHNAIKALKKESTLIINDGHIHNTALLFSVMGDGKDPAVQVGEICQQLRLSKRPE